MTTHVDRYSVTTYGRRWAVLDLLHTDGHPVIFTTQAAAQDHAHQLNQTDRAPRTPRPPQPAQAALFNTTEATA